MERPRRQLRSGVAIFEANQGSLATVLGICNEAWVHIMLSEHPLQKLEEAEKRPISPQELQVQ